MTPSPLRILLVEDNPGDARLTIETFNEMAPGKIFTVMADGAMALDYLEHPENQGETTRPHLILLDLNLPKISGKEVLERIKKTKSLAFIPVIVFTTSKAEKDIRDCYELGVNCFLTKPVTLDEFTKLLGLLDSFWCQVARLP